jgi:hypothetical protein
VQGAASHAGGWVLRKSCIAGDLLSYRDYVTSSRGEIGITKGAYVNGRSGWFSDRSAAYLASGRPVIAQSTGFERCLPTGCGLLCFADLNQAAHAVDSVEANYARHSRAARDIADHFLDYRKTLPDMLEISTNSAARVRSGRDSGQPTRALT